MVCKAQEAGYQITASRPIICRDEDGEDNGYLS